MYGLPSPKSAIVSTSPRSLKASGRPLAANDDASVGGGSAAGSSTDRLKSAWWRASASRRSRSEASTKAYTPTPIAATVNATSRTSVTASRVRMPPKLRSSSRASRRAQVDGRAAL